MSSVSTSRSRKSHSCTEVTSCTTHSLYSASQGFCRAPHRWRPSNKNPARFPGRAWTHSSRVHAMMQAASEQSEIAALLGEPLPYRSALAQPADAIAIRRRQRPGIRPALRDRANSMAAAATGSRGRAGVMNCAMRKPMSRNATSRIIPANLAISWQRSERSHRARGQGERTDSQCLFASGALAAVVEIAGSGSCAPPGALGSCEFTARPPKSHRPAAGRSRSRPQPRTANASANSGQISLGRDRRSRQEPVSSSTGRGHVRLPPFATRFAASPLGTAALSPRGDLSRRSNMRGQTALLDQLISPNQQSQWHLNPKRLGGL